jgi:type III secretion protein U
MSESAGEKSELPTPKKERDARKQGQVARSQEVVTTISLFGVLLVTMAFGGEIWGRLVALLDTIARLAASGEPEAMSTGLAAAYNEMVVILLPILGVTLLLGIAANYIQVGSLFSLQAIQPKLEKISINKGIKRIFSMKQLVEMLKSIVKIVFLSFLLYFVIKNSIGPYLTAIYCDMNCLATVTTAVIWQMLWYSALAFVIVAGLDFMYQRHSHTKSLMMSKDEVKREYKESEGDPIVKGQRKQFAMELVMGDMKKQVPKASAVIVNPTHLAVAIRYREGQTPLPIVVAKGREKQANMIRAEAEAAGVPIFRNVPLARQMYADCEVDSYVPDELFGVIAEILAWVQRNEEGLYAGPLRHGDLDMERGDHRPREQHPA